MSHYYSKTQDEIESNPSTYNFNYKGNSYVFKTDNGVFSKDYIDYGSFAMLNAFTPNNIEGPVLDMGAGYGPISTVLAKQYNLPVYSVEINERAYNLSLENFKRNNVTVNAYNGSLYEPLPDDIKFASIVTNPPIRAGKETVFAIYDGAYEHLQDGGELWVVIQKKQGAPSSKSHLEELFGNAEIVNRDRGYYILKSIKQKK